MSDQNKRLSRRTFLKGSAGAIAAALAASSLPSLANAASQTGAKFQIPHFADKVKIRWIEWMTPEISEEAMVGVLKGFAATEAGKNIEIERVSLPHSQMHEAITTQHLAKQLPDVVQMNGPWQVEFAEMGVMEPIDAYLAKAGKDYVDALVQAPMTPWKSKTYLLPVTSIPFLLFYNEKKLADAGLSKPPATWAEVEQVAPKLTDPTKNTYAFSSGMAAKSPYNGPEIEILPLIYQQNETAAKDGKANLTSAGAIKALKWYVKLVNDLKVYAPGVTTNIEEDKVETFGAETTAMLNTNVAFVTVFAQRNPNLKYGLAPLPSDATFGTNLTGWNNSMNVNSKQKEAAWEFMQWLSGPEGNALITIASKHLPANTKADISSMIKAEPRLQVPLDILKKGRCFTEAFTMPSFTDAMRIWDEQILLALAGKASVEDAMKVTNDEWDKLWTAKK